MLAAGGARSSSWSSSGRHPPRLRLRLIPGSRLPDAGARPLDLMLVEELAGAALSGG
jgi:hypothetical protein